MRYLLHNTDATYDSTTKTWFFNLDRRISNPTTLGLSKAFFSPVSTLSPLPHVIFMHSRALSDMIRDKHTVILRGDSHENSSDVIAILEETHTRGRYGLKAKDMSFRVNPHTVKRQIDIYFTDGTGTHLDGVVAAGGGGGQASGPADDSTIEALSDVVMWLDFSDPSRMLDGSYVQISGTPGDRFHTLQNRSPGTVGLIWAANTYEGMQLAAFGDNTFGMIGYNSWAAMGDSSNNNPIVSNPCSFSSLFQVPPTTQDCALFKNNANFQFNLSNNTFSWPNALGGNNWDTVQGTTFMPGSRWFFQMSHEDDYDGDGTIAVSGLFRNLATGTEYTQTGTRPAWESNAFTNWEMSNASGHFEQIQSHLIITNNTDAADLLTIKNWMLAKYDAEPAGEEEPAPVTEDASFFAELNLNVR